jgi:hypothetical protein
MSHKFISLVLPSVLASVVLVGSAAGAEPPKAPPAPVAGKVTLGLTIAETELIAVGYRGSKLLGAEVRNDKREKIGKIDDFVITPNGALSVAIIEVGGFLGIGAHLVAIPVRKLTLSGAEPNVVLPGATKAALKALPEFKYTS